MIPARTVEIANECSTGNPDAATCTGAIILKVFINIE